MDPERVVNLVIALVGAFGGLYGIWLNRHKIYADARKTTEEAETEDVKQRGSEIDNLRAINDEWQRQYGLVVQRQDEIKVELKSELQKCRDDLEAEIARRQNIETSAAERITELEQLYTAAHDARLKSDKRAQAQAQHIINLQNEVQAARAENQTLLNKLEALTATITSLKKINADKDRQIASLRKDLSEMQVKLRAYEIREKQ